MKEQFLNHIQDSRLCEKSDKVLLAVSGGLDSMVMLDLFHSNGFIIGVAHCNFQLRGNESDGDEELVRKRCEQLGVKCFVEHFPTSAYAAQNSLSIQLAARELRYAWFAELLKQHSYKHLATAHHLNDNMETVLMNFVRGSAVKGIPEKNESTIRPLLQFSRHQLEAYAKEQGIVWREDSSNATDDYSRNFIRHRITPLLRELNPGLENGFHRTIKRLMSSRELARKQIEQIRKEFVTASVGRITIQKSFASSVEHAAPVLWELIKEYAFNFDQAEEIISALYGESGKRFLSAGYQLVVDRDVLIITAHEKFWDDVVIEDSKVQPVLGPWTLMMENPSVINVESDPFVAWLDSDLVKFPLTWRVWRKGDFFYPLGMAHRKKVSDFLIDNKLALTDKDYVTVLESGGNIVWVAGYRIDNRYKVTKETRNAIKLSVEQYFV